MMLMASKGHFFGQIPQPIHRRSEMKAILLSGATSMHSLPVRTTGHDFLHSCLHFFGLPGSIRESGDWLKEGPLEHTLVRIDDGDTTLHLANISRLAVEGFV